MNEPKKTPPALRMAIEFGPLVAFFVTQRVTDRLNGLYWATIVFMVATAIALAASRLLERRWPTVPLITAVFVGVMGGLTIWLDSELFIKLKPTLVNGLFAAILLIGLAKKRLFLKSILGEALPLTEAGWELLTKRFGLWFVFLALLNEVLRISLSTNGWTTFKTFGLPVLTFAFLFSQAGVLARHQVAATEE